MTIERSRIIVDTKGQVWIDETFIDESAELYDQLVDLLRSNGHELPPRTMIAFAVGSRFFRDDIVVFEITEDGFVIAGDPTTNPYLAYTALRTWVFTTRSCDWRRKKHCDDRIDFGGIGSLIKIKGAPQA